MDTPKLTHISLRAGYGGIDLGLRRVLPDLRTIVYSEIEEYACGLLAARMESGHLDPAPIWSDLKTFPFSEFHSCVDILSGGYPCQPFSAAGKRRGTDDPRHLWPFIADGIQLCQPRICFFENVEGHISLGLQDVLGDLADLGYRATWGLFSAAEVGAPHQRKRVFILAHRAGSRLEGLLSEPRQSADVELGKRCPSVWPSRPSEPQNGWEPPRVVANPDCRRLEGAGAEPGRASDAVGSDRESGKIVADAVRNGRSTAERNSTTMGGEERSQEGHQSESGPVASSFDCGSSMGNARGQKSSGLSSGRGRDQVAEVGQSGQRQAQPALGGDADGPAGGLDYANLCVACDNRTDELRLLGNGVVPATAERAFRTLYARIFP